MAVLLDNKKIFLAGAVGMAGGSILRYIAKNCPTAKVRGSYHVTEPFFKHPQVEYVQGDLNKVEDCRRMAAGCDCAVMTASYAGGAGFMKAHPWEHMKENLLMNLQMLEAFKDEGVKRVIFVSSATVYQEFEGHVKEDQLDYNEDPYDIYFGYGWAVRFIGKLCKLMHDRFGIEAVVARTANIFGPYDKFDPAKSNFIPALIRKAIDKTDPFEVWGSPDVTRDVIYSDDFARAIVLMADAEEIKNDVFNVGSGVKTTVGDVVRWVLEYSGHSPSEVKYLQDKPTTIKFRALDCSKAKEMLGWEPELTVEQGVKETLNWWNENKGRWTK